MGSKKKTTEETNQVQTAAPPSWAEPTMIDLAHQIQSAVGQVRDLPGYSGDFIAQPGAMQNAVPGAYNEAAALAHALVNPATQALAATGVAPTFDVTSLAPALQSFGGSNPGGMNAAVNAAIDPVRQTLMEQVLPSLQSSGIESGAYGGSRAQVTLPAQALQDFSHEAGNIAAQLRYQDYTDTANRLLQGYGLSTERGLGTANVLTDRLGLTPDLLDAIMRMSGGSAELLAQGATADLANRQSVIDNNMQRYQYNVQRPFMGYDIATDLISRLANGYGTNTLNGTTTTTQTTGGLAPIIGGALGAGMGLLSLPMGGGGSLGGSLVSGLFGQRNG